MHHSRSYCFPAICVIFTCQNKLSSLLPRDFNLTFNPTAWHFLFTFHYSASQLVFPTLGFQFNHSDTLSTSPLHFILHLGFLFIRISNYMFMYVLPLKFKLHDLISVIEFSIFNVHIIDFFFLLSFLKCFTFNSIFEL